MARKALTLMELLIVLGIVALLLAITLPAIQMGREAARRSSCANKLRQIGVALHSYMAANDVFPPRAIYWEGTGNLVGGPWSVNVLLLTHLEAVALYNSINLSLHLQDGANTTVLSLSPELYLCPSDTHLSGGPSGVCNFKPCVGSGRFGLGLDALIDLSVRPNSDGLFSTTHGMQTADVTDGLSHTAAFSEMVHGSGLGYGDWTKLPTPTLGLIYRIKVSPKTQRNLVEKCRNITFAGTGVTTAGEVWCAALEYNHLFTPDQASCWGQGMGNDFSAITASSRHGRGVNLLFGDGHVKFVGKNIDEEIWHALGSRAGGEQINF